MFRLLPLLLACACASPAPAPTPARAPTPAPAAVSASSASLHLLFTADEHGWLLPLNDKKAQLRKGGVVALWEALRAEGYSADGRAAGWLLASAGDMWTGPYETTVLEGAPMVAAMSHMGYAAAAIGNHEFDFGVRVIAERQKAATFPFLAANLVEVATGKQPAWAKPFTIVDAGGTKVGIVGLTNLESPVTSDPRHMTGLKFLPYEPALDEWIPKARAAGAQQIVVLAHEGLDEVMAFAPTLRKHKVRAVAAGHHHAHGVRVDDNGTPAADDDVIVCNGGAYTRGYCRIDLEIANGAVTKHTEKLGTVEQPLADPPPAGDPKLAAIVGEAERSANQIGGEVLIENLHPMTRGVDGAMGQFVVDAWREALPYAQVAITNAGGMRQDLAAGEVRVKDVVSVMPFNNYLLVVDLTGAQLRTVLESEEPVVSGIRYTFKVVGGKKTVVDVVDAKGASIPVDAKLKVIIIDFMYRGGDRYEFNKYDAEPEETAIDWREPVLRKLRDMGKAGKKLDVNADDRGKKI